MKIQINDQGREFVNKVSKNLQNMIGTEYPANIGNEYLQRIILNQMSFVNDRI